MLVNQPGAGDVTAYLPKVKHYRTYLIHIRFKGRIMPVDPMAINWWGGLQLETRNVLISSLFTFIGMAAPKVDKDDEAKKESDESAVKDVIIERLTSILTSGEAEWQNRFLRLQATRDVESNIRMKSDSDFRETLSRMQRENVDLRSKLDAEARRKEELACIEANSSLKGQKYEKVMEIAIRAAFPTAVYTNTASMARHGDGILFEPNFGPHKCLLEYKSHGKSIGEADVTKLGRDLDQSKASFAIMLTRTANVAGKRDFDIETTAAGKPILFLVRTDECITNIGTIMRLAMRFLVRFVEDTTNGGTMNPTEIAARYARTYRKLKTNITKFDMQWKVMRESMIAGIDDLKDIVTPELTAPVLSNALTVFEDRAEPVPVEEIQATLKYRYPNVAKRTLIKLLRKQSHLCDVIIARPDKPCWSALCREDDKRKTATFVLFQPKSNEE